MCKDDWIMFGLILAFVLGLVVSVQCCVVKESRLKLERFKIKAEACSLKPELCIPGPKL